MSENICAFCLGDRTDAPVFGSRRDAQDFVKPCSSCSLVTHRRCLFDWFRSLKESQLMRTQDETQRQEGTYNAANAAGEDTSFINITTYPEVRASVYMALGSTFRSPELLVNETEINSAQCPQCKAPIKFQTGELSFMNLYESLHSLVYSTMYYSGISLVITGATTGVFVLAYKTLGQCGINIIDTIKPPSISLPAFKRNKLIWRELASKPLLVLLRERRQGPIFRTMLTYDYVPLLPIVMYRMRCLLPFDLLFSKNKLSMFDALSELQVCNYFSSLGSHVLVKQVWHNSQVMWNNFLANGTFSSLKLSNLVKNVNWWDPNVMMGSIIPARWAYDLIYRFLINRVYLNITAPVQPRAIVNSLSAAEAFRFESLTLESTRLEVSLERKVNKQMSQRKDDNFVPRFFVTIYMYATDYQFYKILKVKSLLWFEKTKASTKNDYSRCLVNHLVIISFISTLLWPLLAADIGRVLVKILIQRKVFPNVEFSKLEFMANLVGMGFAALVKDVTNLLIARVKAQQLSKITIVKDTRTSLRSRPSADSSNIPGAYMNFII